MPESLKEFLTKICADSSALFANEESTKLGAVQPILSLLGWNTQNGREVHPEFPVGSDRVDYCLVSGPRKVFIEVKAAGKNLNGHQQQLLGYAFRYGVELAALTTGLEWWLYLPLKRGAWQERRFAVIDVKKDDNAANRLTAFLSRRTILDGSAFRTAEKAIIEKNLPRAWSELYKEQRDSLVESLRKKLRDQTGYEPLPQHLEYFLDKQVGASSGSAQRLSDTPTRLEGTRDVGKAEKVLEVLQDGRWHTSSELRERLRVSSINNVLKGLQDQGKVELSREQGKYRARLVGANRPIKPQVEPEAAVSPECAESPYTAQSKLRGIFEDLKKGLPKGEIERLAGFAGLDPKFTRRRLINDGKGLRGWKWVLHEEDGKEYVKITQNPTSGHG